MLNSIYNYIVARFQDDSMVHTITFNDTFVVDTQKENIYPIVAINLVSISEANDLNLYNFRITCLQKRDVQRIMTPSKLMDDTNLIDNLAETENILQNFTNYITRLEIEENISIQEKSNLTPLYNHTGNGVDGFQVNITFSYPNNGYC
jgi:hypothetical protein